MSSESDDRLPLQAKIGFVLGYICAVYLGIEDGHQHIFLIITYGGIIGGFVGMMTVGGVQLVLMFFWGLIKQRKLDKSRVAALDKHRDYHERTLGIDSLSGHWEFTDDLIRIALDKGEQYEVRRNAIYGLRYREPRNGYDNISEDNFKKSDTLADISTDETDDDLIRENAIKVFSSHIDNCSGDIDRYLGLLKNRTLIEKLRTTAITELSPRQGSSCYKRLMITIIMIVEDETESDTIRRLSIGRLNPDIHKDVLWALKKDKSSSVRYAANDMLHPN